MAVDNHVDRQSCPRIGWNGHAHNGERNLDLSTHNRERRARITGNISRISGNANHPQSRTSQRSSCPFLYVLVGIYYWWVSYGVSNWWLDRLVLWTTFGCPQPRRTCQQILQKLFNPTKRTGNTRSTTNRPAHSFNARAFPVMRDRNLSPA